MPGGEVSPAVRLGAVQLQVGTRGDKLLHQYPWAKREKVTFPYTWGKDKPEGTFLCRGEAVVVFAQENDSKVPSQGMPQACPQALLCQRLPTTNSSNAVGESGCCASRYWGRDSSSYHHHHLLPTRAKKALTAPSKSSARPWPGWPSVSPFLLKYFRGYRTDHHRPKAKKKVPRRALPRKLVGIGLVLWTCKDKQCLMANLKHPRGSCWAAQHPQGPTS